MTRWIVNPRTHEVYATQPLSPLEARGSLRDGEFLFDAPTAADAAMAGRRHNLAVEALESLPEELDADPWFQVLGDRIVWSMAGSEGAVRSLGELQRWMDGQGFEVWREGLALVVLARRAPVAEDSGSAWVSEIGSDR